MKFTLLSLAGTALAVPLQHKQFFGMGIYVSVGTPAQTYFMAPDFSGDEIRIFAGAQTRMPHHPAVGHSSSMTSGPDGKLVDNVTFADIDFTAVPLTMERSMALADSFHYSDSEGRVPLGPKSPFLRSRVAALSPAQILNGRTYTTGIDLQLIEAIPEAVPGFTDHVCPLVRRARSWTVKGGLTLNGQAMSPHGIEVQFDFHLVGSIEVPRESMSRLVTILGANTRDVWVENTGRLLLPCDERTRVISVASTFQMQLSAGGPVLTFEFAKDMAGGNRPVERHPRSGAAICRTGFKVNLHESVWKVSPLSVVNATTVYLDGVHKQLVIRVAADVAQLPLVAMEAVAPPRIPVYSQFSVSTADGITTIEFPAVNQDPREMGTFTLRNGRASQKSDGSLYFSLTGASVREFTPTTHTIPGVFQLTSQPDLTISRPDLSLVLKLRNVDPNAVGRKYTLEVIYTSLLMTIALTPFRGQSRSSGHEGQIAALEQLVYDSMTDLGASARK